MAKKPMGWRGRLLVCIMALSAIAAIPTTVLFTVGMLPTFMSRFTDHSKGRTRAMTVGFMNFAACFPFWYQLMHKGHTLANATDMITDPLTIVIMYMGAVAGYLIEWGLSGIVANLMVVRGRKRLDDIAVMQATLIRQWGPEVAGDMALDQSGFPLEQPKG